MSGVPIKETGNRYGRLTVLGFAYTKRGTAYWECQCSCKDKSIVIIVGGNLRRKKGGVKSCGCLQKEQLIERNKQPISSATRQKLSKASSGKNNGMFGKHLSRDAKERISKKMKGNKHPKWNPNITNEERKVKRNYLKYKEWRKAVYRRDDYTCQRCSDNNGGNLNAHHIESYRDNSNIRTEVSNGITLCKECHLDFHHQYGYGNNTMEQLEMFSQC